MTGNPCDNTSACSLTYICCPVLCKTNPIQTGLLDSLSCLRTGPQGSSPHPVFTSFYEKKPDSAQSMNTFCKITRWPSSFYLICIFWIDSIQSKESTNNTHLGVKIQTLDLKLITVWIRYISIKKCREYIIFIRHVIVQSWVLQIWSRT